MPNYPKMMGTIAQWAKGLPNAQDVQSLMEHALQATRETGQEHMVHQPTPGQHAPVLRIGDTSSVAAHPDMYAAQKWLGEQFPEYNFHTHPSGVMTPSSVFRAVPERTQGLEQAAGNRLTDVPWFSGPDMKFYNDMAFKHEPPESMRFSVGTPNEGNFLGAQLRGAPSAYMTPSEAALGKLRELDSVGRRGMSEQDTQAMRSRLTGEFGLHGDFLDNVASTAPLFKAQGDLVEPLSYHFNNPAYEDIINEYISRSGMRDGGIVDE